MGEEAAERFPTGPGSTRHRLGFAVPAAWSTVLLGSGLAYFFGWGPLVLHHSQWMTGGDLWGIFRAAHYVGWGDLGAIYHPSTGFVSFPGIAVVLAPVAMLSGHLGLTESAPGYLLTHPQAALLVEPAELLLACTVVFASDSLARTLGVPTRRRAVLVGAVAVIAWPVVAVWGHVEDVVAVALLLWALRALIGGRDRVTGWLVGAGVLMQPLVGLAAPIVLAATRPGRRMATLVRSAAPAAVLLAIAAAGNVHNAYRAVVEQPTPPVINHATPWTSLAPKVGSRQGITTTQTILQHVHGRYVTSVLISHSVVVVSGGPIRTIAVVGAVLIGLFVWRKRPDVTGLVWLVAVALALRCYFEPVMTPYYLAPPLIAALIAASRSTWWRFAVAVVVAAGDTVFAYERYSPWVWWLQVMGMLTVVLACGFPGRVHLFADGIPDPTASTVGVDGAGDLDPPAGSERPDGVLASGNPLP